MHLVDDVDLVGRRGRAVLHRIDDLADVVDAGVGGGVHLHDVDMPSFGNCAVVDAFLAQVERRMRAGGVLIIQRPRQDARRRRLAHAANAGEHEGVRNAPGFEGVAQRLHHGILPDELVKARRPEFARQDQVGLGRRRAAGCRWGFAVEHQS